MLIQGELLIEGEVVDLSGATVYVRILDTSLADAASLTISEYKVEALSDGTKTSDRIPFELILDNFDPKRDYTLAAHIDLTGDGQRSVGDYITMESFPVHLENPPISYVLRVRKIN